MKGVSGRRWLLLSDCITPESELSKKYGYFLAQLMVNRGFEDPKSAFDLKLKYLLPYVYIPNIEEASERIIKAVKKKERILLFGDYDVDGITATTILYEILKEANARVIPILPSRKTGYGLNSELVNLFSRYADLLITVDNGTSAVTEIDTANIDVIVIDHHNVPNLIPRRAILVNPKLRDDIPTDFKELSSAAMCFYMAFLLARKLELDRDIRVLLDLVALGTVGDVMPMNRTNRILVSKGILLMEEILKGSLNKPGLKALMQLAGIKERLSAKDIAYSLAPRINAPGRVGNPKLALQLLLEKKKRRAESLARKLELINTKRKIITDRVYQEALKRVKFQEHKSFISLWDSRWHPGVLGIVAGRLANSVGKPVAVFSEGKDQSVGSVRSVEGIDVYEGLKQLSFMFLKWGGHSQAAGLTLRSDLLEIFSQEADSVFRNVLIEPPPIYIDMKLSPEDITPQRLADIKKLEPYGEGNPFPTFLSDRCRIDSVIPTANRVKVKSGKIEMICWEKNVAEHLRKGSVTTVVYSVVGKEYYILDVEDPYGAG